MKNNSMATAALVLGIISIVLSFCFGIGFLIGAFGIFFAILSRRHKMETRAVAGLALSIIAIVISIVIILILIFQYGGTFSIHIGNNRYFDDDYDSYSDDYYDDDYDYYGGYNDDYYNDDYYNNDYYNDDYFDDYYGDDYDSFFDFSNPFGYDYGYDYYPEEGGNKL